MVKIHSISPSAIMQILILWQCSPTTWHPVRGDVPRVNIRGAGASFPATVYKRWIENYQTLRQDYVRLKMPYESTGSGKGNDLMVKGTSIQYAGTEHLLDPKLYKNLAFFPTMAGAIALAYNLPEIKKLGLVLNLTREQVVGIFNGTYNYWNDTTFQISNPNVRMPDKEISVVVRRGKSGTTGIFTSALSAFSESWKNQYGDFLEGVNETTEIPYYWNDTVIKYYGKQSSGLAGIVASFKYSIGYMSVSESKGLQLGLANIRNKAGFFIPSGEVAAVQSAINTHLKLTNSLTGTLVNLGGTNTYPIAGFTYMLIRLKVSGSCPVMKELVRFISWFSTAREAKDLCVQQGMVPITKAVAEQIEKDVLKKITCDGASVWDMVEKDKADEIYMAQTWRTPVAATAPFVILLIIALLSYIIHQRLKLMKMINNDEWNINIEDILFYFDEKTTNSKSRMLYSKSIKSLKSLDDIPDGDLILSQILQWPGRWKAHQIGIRLLNLQGFNNIDWRTKRELIWMRDQVIHRNVLRFYGLTEVDIENKYVVSEYSSKGPLLDILQDEKFNLTEDFKFSLSVDIASGMSFLHTVGINHGNLRTSCCMLDSRWMVKIADWEYCRLYSFIHPTKNPILWMRQDASEIGDYASDFRDFWTAPEILISSFTKFPTNNSDVYSFAIILQEIFTRDDPYVEHADTMTPSEVLNAIKFHNLRPQPTDDLPLSVRQTMEIAWSDIPSSRPSFDQILKMLKHAKPSRKSVLDSMMEAMEEYTIHLEDRIEERTNELNLAKQTMEEQLSRFIPKPLLSNLIGVGELRSQQYNNNCLLAMELHDFKLLVSTNTSDRVVSILQKVHTLIETNVERRQVYQIAAETGAWMYIAGLDNNASGLVQNTVTLANLALDCQENMIDREELGDLQLRSALHIGNVQASHVVSPNAVYILGHDLNETKRLLSERKSFEIRISEQVREILSAEKIFEIQSDFGSDSKEPCFWLTSRSSIVTEVTSTSSSGADSGIEQKESSKCSDFPEVQIIIEEEQQDDSQSNDQRDDQQHDSRLDDQRHNARSNDQQNYQLGYQQHDSRSNDQRGDQLGDQQHDSRSNDQRGDQLGDQQHDSRSNDQRGDQLGDQQHDSRSNDQRGDQLGDQQHDSRLDDQRDKARFGDQQQDEQPHRNSFLTPDTNVHQSTPDYLTNPRIKSGQIRQIMPTNKVSPLGSPLKKK